MENYLAAKMKLFEPDRCKIAVYNADDERVSQAMSRVQIPRVDYGIRVSSDIYAKNIEVGERGCSFQIVFNKRFKLQIDLKLSGIFNVYNAMTAAVMCDALGVPSEAIKAGLESVKGVPGRIELLETETPLPGHFGLRPFAGQPGKYLEHHSGHRPRPGDRGLWLRRR